jgi:putative oxidoreductase
MNKERRSMAKPTTTRPGTDLAALLLRLTIGPMMMVHGLNKVRGPGGLQGTTNYFNSLCLQPAHVHARVAAATEIGTGALLTVGAMTPLASAGVIGVMTSAAATDHKGKGFFIFKGGWEYVGVVGATSAVIALLGPGRFSFDGRRGRRGGHGGFGRFLFAAGLGVGAALGMLATSRKEPVVVVAESVTVEEAPAGEGAAS